MKKAKYYFFLSPYNEHAFTKCPKCENKTKIKKIPLVIALNKTKVLLNLYKTCKFCPYCNLLIAKKHDIEEFLNQFSSLPNYNIEDFFIIGTIDKKYYLKGIKNLLSFEEECKNITPFKDFLKFEFIGYRIRDCLNEERENEPKSRP